jgi:tripartite-type tricarboxylate transporter receptor subunit TctC
MAAFTHAVNVSLYRSIDYDPVADFQPVTLLSYQPCVIIVPNASPVKSVADFINYAKANRGKISYASPCHGTSPHLCGELFERMTGIEMTHVPHRTGAQQDLVAGHVDVMFAVAPFDLLRAGLAVTTAGRGSTRSADDGGIRPGGLRRRTDAIAVQAEPAVHKSMQDLGSTTVGSTPEELTRYLQAEIAKWGSVIRDANIRLDG